MSAATRADFRADGRWCECNAPPYRPPCGYCEAPEACDWCGAEIEDDRDAGPVLCDDCERDRAVSATEHGYSLGLAWLPVEAADPSTPARWVRVGHRLAGAGGRLVEGAAARRVGFYDVVAGDGALADVALLAGPAAVDAYDRGREDGRRALAAVREGFAGRRG